MKTEQVLTKNAVVQQAGLGPEVCVVWDLLINIFSSLKNTLIQCHKEIPNISSIWDLQIILFGIQMQLAQGHWKN